MAQINKVQFVDSMLHKIDDQLSFVNSLSKEDKEVLAQKPGVKAWNALECVDHMNKALKLYTDQIVPLKLEEGVENTVSIGWKGRFFAEGMRPKEEKISYKMPTTKVFTPINTDMDVINSFRDTLQSAKDFLEANKNTVWKGKKVTSALGPLVKFNIAEAYNFLLAHNERHILQAERAMNRA